MKFLVNYLDFKGTLRTMFYSIKMLFELAIECLDKKRKEKVLAITSGSSTDNTTKVEEDNTSKPAPKFSFVSILRKLYGMPKITVLFYMQGLVRLARDLRHYYTNFYLKSKPISDLYPEYKNLNISKSVQRAIINNTNYSTLSL